LAIRMIRQIEDAHLDPASEDVQFFLDTAKNIQLFADSNLSVEDRKMQNQKRIIELEEQLQQDGILTIEEMGELKNSFEQYIGENIEGFITDYNNARIVAGK